MNASLLQWPSRLLVRLLIGLIWVYQHTISPLLGNVCRYEPTCSRYMVASLQKYGLAKGLLKGIGRVFRCHPWGGGGYDPP